MISWALVFYFSKLNNLFTIFLIANVIYLPSCIHALFKHFMGFKKKYTGFINLQ